MSRRRKRSLLSRGPLAVSAGIVVLGVILGLVLASGRFRSEQSPPTSSAPVRPAPLAPRAKPVPAIPAPERPSRPEPAGRVAIIFDDAGGSLEDLEGIIALGRPVTVAVLPGLRYSKEVAARAQAAGLEVFLHLPVEPEDPTKAMGPGGIAVSMSDAEIEASVRQSLAAMPGVVGVNNHMGSRGTADPRVMRAVLRVVKEQHLLFVDSVTTPRSIAGVLASEMRIPSASREVFLDNEDSAGAIRVQLRRALTRARRTGRAVAIGHASRLTAQVLAEMLGEFDRAGIALVPASALAR